jgi:hypothetical protein
VGEIFRGCSVHTDRDGSLDADYLTPGESSHQLLHLLSTNRRRPLKQGARVSARASVTACAAAYPARTRERGRETRTREERKKQRALVQVPPGTVRWPRRNEGQRAALKTNRRPPARRPRRRHDTFGSVRCVRCIVSKFLLSLSLSPPTRDTPRGWQVPRHNEAARHGGTVLAFSSVRILIADPYNSHQLYPNEKIHEPRNDTRRRNNMKVHRKVAAAAPLSFLRPQPSRWSVRSFVFPALLRSLPWPVNRHGGKAGRRKEAKDPGIDQAIKCPR